MIGIWAQSFAVATRLERLEPQPQRKRIVEQRTKNLRHKKI